ncbi:MAG: hypothetical protein A2173_04735 [Planctomycetes bacterium RBG_13_44_8b]|nr:MAG: hypothetical protein A2173_04735 [Planctomycetes bacterium RBG_13_44_8b]
MECIEDLCMCIYDDCYDCNHTTHVCEDKCKPEFCEECDGAGLGICLLSCDWLEYENCCNGTCYDERTHGCCGGLVYDKATQCCIDGERVEKCGGVSWGDCCPDGLSCCSKKCYDPAAEHCCVDPTGEYYTCVNGKECCYNELFDIHYCVLPCRDEVTNTTNCSKDNEPSHNSCYGCQQLVPLTCSGVYREYTGLKIKTCYDGCPMYDWNRSSEDCYIVRKCFAMPHTDSWCTECEGEIACWPVVREFRPPSGDEFCITEGKCAAEVICDRIAVCFQCEKVEGSEIIMTVTSETCNCK